MVAVVVAAVLRHVAHAQARLRIRGRRTHAHIHMSDPKETLPLLAEMTTSQQKDILWSVGTTIGKTLWDMHDETLWKPDAALPTGQDEERLIVTTQAEVTRVLLDKQLLQVRESAFKDDHEKYDAIVVGRMYAFFQALLRIGHAAVKQYRAWPATRDTLPSVQCDDTTGAPPFDFPDLVEVSVELHFKACLARAVDKALKNPDEPLRNVFESPVELEDDEDEESVDEGSSIGDGSDEESGEEEEDSDSTDASEEEDEAEEEAPPKKKSKA